MPIPAVQQLLDRHALWGWGQKRVSGTGDLDSLVHSGLSWESGSESLIFWEVTLGKALGLFEPLVPHLHDKGNNLIGLESNLEKPFQL